MNSLDELTAKAAKVSDIYAETFDINRDDLWHLAKISEEAGELTAAYLKLSGRGRTRDLPEDTLRKDMEEEAADLLAHLLLFCRHQEIDLEAAIERKWFSRLKA